MRIPEKYKYIPGHDAYIGFYENTILSLYLKRLANEYCDDLCLSDKDHRKLHHLAEKKYKRYECFDCDSSYDEHRFCCNSYF